MFNLDKEKLDFVSNVAKKNCLNLERRPKNMKYHLF